MRSPPLRPTGRWGGLTGALPRQGAPADSDPPAAATGATCWPAARSAGCSPGPVVCPPPLEPPACSRCPIALARWVGHLQNEPTMGSRLFLRRVRHSCALTPALRACPRICPAAATAAPDCGDPKPKLNDAVTGPPGSGQNLGMTGRAGAPLGDCFDVLHRCGEPLAERFADLARSAVRSAARLEEVLPWPRPAPAGLSVG